MSQRIRIATVAATLAAVLAVVAAAGASAAAPPPSVDPGVDYHSVHLHLKPTKVAELPVANCSDTWGIGSGNCNGISSAEPDFGTAWKTTWSPCPTSRHSNADCPRGSIAVTIDAGNNHLKGYVLGRNRGELYITSADAPAWHPLSPITAESSGAAGQKGGPLSIDVENSFGDRYTFDIKGFLLYKKLLQTFGISGYLDYGTTDEPLTNHAFQATLEVLDTPSQPQCSNANFRGIGGCYGTFTPGSDKPFVGAGGSAGIHWRQEDVTRVELVAPSGSRFGGQLDGSADRFKVNYGQVPEWDQRTGITTGTFSGRTGEKGGPLRLTINQCCSKPPGAGPPLAKIKEEKVSPRRHRAKFHFKGSGGSGDLYLGCKLDGRKFKSCDSPKTYRHLKQGRHVFKVKAKDSVGKSSRKSAKVKFRI